MNPRRFLLDPGDVRDGAVVLRGPELRHLRDVLRLRPGDGVELLDPVGRVFTARIKDIDRQRALLEITASRRAGVGRTCLAAGILKGARMDMVVEKAAEFGIATLVPLASRHAVAGRVRPGRMERWHRVAAAACKQCGRAVPLGITAPMSLGELLERRRGPGLGLLFHEKAPRTPGSELAALPWDNDGETIAVVGPEGGFDQDEVEEAVRAGFVAVGLGPLVLRAETAAIAAMTIVRLFSGDNGGE